MGVYLNPGSGSFQQIRNGIYIDKTDFGSKDDVLTLLI